MKLNDAQAEMVEELLASYLGDVHRQACDERIGYWTNRLVSGKLTHEEYIEAAASIRATEYIRDEPFNLVRKANRARPT